MRLRILALAISLPLAQSALAQEASKAASPPAEVCLTNACSDPLKAGDVPSNKEVAQTRAWAQMSFMQAGYFPKEGSKMREGYRVDLATQLRTESGEVLAFTVTPGPNETAFAHTEPSKAPYMIGAQIDAAGPIMQLDSAFRLNGEDVVVPRQSVTPGEPVTVALPGGRQLTVTATLRPETEQERRRSEVARARMRETAAATAAR